MKKKVAKKEKDTKPKAKRFKEEEMPRDPPRLTYMQRKEMEMELHTNEVTIARKDRQIAKFKIKVKELKSKKSQSAAPLADEIQTLKGRIAKLESLRKEAADEAREANNSRKEAGRKLNEANREAGEAHAGYLDITRRFENEKKLYSMCEIHAKKKKPVENCKCPVCVLLARQIEQREDTFAEIKKRKKAETALWKLQSKQEQKKRQTRK